MKTTTARIATVKATGSQYIVDRISFGRTAKDPSIVYCLGEVVALRGSATTHAPESKKFNIADVDVREVERTDALALALLKQHVEARRAAGATVVRTRGNNYRDLGTPEQQLARHQENRAIAESLLASPELRGLVVKAICNRL